MHRFDGGQRRRGDAVAERVEADAAQEPAPLGRRLATGVAGEGVGVVVAVDVPAPGRNLGDGIGAGHDLSPELLEIIGTGEQRLHADDGDVEGVGLRFGFTDRHPGSGRARGVPGVPRRAAVTDHGVQVGDGRDRVAEGGHLADHVHAFATLVVGVDGDQAGVVAHDSLRGDAEPPQVERLQFGPAGLGVDAGVFEFGLASGEGPHEVGLDTAGGVAGGGFEQHGGVAVHSDVLERGLDGPAFHRLFGEQVGGAHQHSDLGSPRRQGGAGRGGHGRGAGIVDASGQEDLEVLGILHGQQTFDLGVPQGEAGTGSDVAAALAAFEHELAGSVLEEPVEQTR